MSVAAQQYAFLNVDEPAARESERILADDTTGVVDPALSSEPTIIRIGEMFVEIGCKIPTTIEAKKAKVWQLRILREDRGVVYTKSHPIERASVVVKLYPNASFFVQTKLGTSGPWSPLGRIRTHAEIVTMIQEVGEDYLRISWDRPLRDTTGLLPELYNSGVAESIEGYQLRLLREQDMVQEYIEEFDSGTRTHTIYGLRASTAYVLYYSSLTTIKTRRQWVEVARFRTIASFNVRLVSRGEDNIKIEWSRDDGSAEGQLLHKFELSLNETHLVEVSAGSPTTHTFCLLQGGVSYTIKLRYLTLQGRWGPWSAPLVVVTSPPVKLYVDHVGQTYATLQYSCEDPDVASIEISVVGVSHAFKFEARDVTMVSDLKPGTQYKAFARAVFKDGAFGLWSSGQEITTRPKCWVNVVERGEDFLTVTWSYPQLRNKIKVIGATSGKIVLDDEIEGAEVTSHRIVGLKAGEEYVIQVQVYEAAGWSCLSDPVRVGTLKPVAMHIVDVGENFVHVAWSRAALGAQAQWQDLKYEFVLGCVDTGVDNVVHREVLDTSYVLNSLIPNTTYVVSVRACDEKEQWGLWCRATFRTLSPVVLLAHEIGEDYLRLMWQRETVNDIPLPSGTNLVTGNAYVSSCTLCVYSLDEGATFGDDSTLDPTENDYAPSIGAEVRRVEHFDSAHTSFRIAGLLADRQYRAVLRAATSTGKWGLWSRELSFRTVAPFRISTSHLSIGENYVTVQWERDDNPIVPAHTRIGDYKVTAVNLHILNIDTQEEKIEKLAADQRRKRIPALTPATPYMVRVRVCNSAGEWGTLSAAVNFVTRPTIMLRRVELAENYLTLAWERKPVECPPGFHTGKEHIKSYHLKVTDKSSYHRDETLVDMQCPFTLYDLQPDSIYYCEIMANYGDGESGLWSNPLACHTMKRLVITQFKDQITEKSITIKWSRGDNQARRMPIGFAEDKQQITYAWGDPRTVYQLRVTTRQPLAQPLSHDDVPTNVSDEVVKVELEVNTEAPEVKHNIPDLKCGTVYGMKVRSKIEGGEWGMWSDTLYLMTLPPIVVNFQSIGEDYLKVEWKRQQMNVGNIPTGTMQITRSHLKIRDLNGGMLYVKDIDTSATVCMLDKNDKQIPALLPSSTYAVCVQTHNGHEWGGWGEETRARTLPPLEIFVEKVGEDFVWLSWMRKPDNDADVTPEACLNLDNAVRAYEIKIVGSNGSDYHKEVTNNSVFVKGLLPDEVFEVRVRALSKTGMWGQFATAAFRTLPCLQIIFGNIGEHFACLNWVRKYPMGQHQSHVKEGDDLIKQFKLRIQRVGQQATTYFLPTSFSGYKFADLIPSSEYRAWIAAQDIDGEWGVWSYEARFRTLPPITLKISAIGENYVQVNWKRKDWEGETCPDPLIGEPNEQVSVHMTEGVVSQYHVRVWNMKNEAVAEAYLGTSISSTKVTGLKAMEAFCISIQAKDTYNEVGLWSEKQNFVTLFPIRLNCMRIGEEFGIFEWDRMDLLRIKELERIRVPTPGADEEGLDEEMSHSHIDELRSFANANPFSAEEIPEFPSDFTRGKEQVKKWQIKVYGNKLFGGFPVADNDMEFEMEAKGDTYVIPKLLPATTYSVQVRGMDPQNEYGSWSPAIEITTMPVIKVEVDYIGEDFFTCRWAREIPAEFPLHLTVYPSPLVEHNYELVVTLIHEDTGLAQEPRIMSTTQTRTPVHDRLPGAYYKVIVREKLSNDVITMLGTSGVASEWGMQSSSLTIEMAPPMVINVKSIGEHYSNVSWQRRLSTATYFNDALRSSAAITSFNLLVNKCDERAQNPTEHLKQSMESSTNKLMLSHLTSNTIYSLQIQAVTDNEHIGQWSPVVYFVTTKALRIRVEVINETNVILSWTRQMPDWVAKKLHNQLSSYAANLEEVGSVATTEDQPVTEDYVTVAQPVDEGSMDFVVTGDYEAASYELEIDGIGHQQQSTVIVNGMTTWRLADLKCNSMYCVRVRSIGADEIWSPHSKRITFLTLNPIEVSFGKVSEIFMYVEWNRKKQLIEEYVALLQESRDVIDQKRLDHEAKLQAQRVREKFERQQEAAHQEEDDGKKPVEVKPKGPPVPVVPEIDPEVYCVLHLQPEAINIGTPGSTAFQIRVFGSGGFPVVRGDVDFFERAESIRHAKKKPTRKHRGKEKIVEKSRDESSLDAATGSITTSTRMVGFREDRTEEQEDMSNLLLELKFGSRTSVIRVDGLFPDVVYQISVRSRNQYEEWSGWTARKTQCTLPKINLLNSGFGEHYVNLYWYRMSPEEIALENEEKTALADWEIVEKQLLDDPQKYQTMTATDREKFMSDRKAIKAREKALSENLQKLKDGKGQLWSANTKIEGFLLRLIRAMDNGECEDVVYTTQDLQLHTFSKLTENNLYVVCLCPNYGDGEWGAWTEPIQFMTQNLLQLSISYIGEHFIHIDWKRTPNKKIKGDEYIHVQQNRIAQGIGHQYQVVLTNMLTNQSTEHTVKDAISFRIQDLSPDTIYSVRVREWDPKGEWGLWSPTRVCATLSRMQVKVTEVGENWIGLDWRRFHSRNNVKEDDPNSVIMPIEVEGYFLSVEEIVEDADKDDKEESFTEIVQQRPQDGEDGAPQQEDEFLSFLKASSGSDNAAAKLPQEKSAFDNPSGRYCLVKALPKDMSKITLDDLLPSKFYKVRVMCRTANSEIGLWSQEAYAVTMNTMNLSIDLVAETSIRLSWNRDKSRRNPSIPAYVHSSEWLPSEYQLQLDNPDGTVSTHKFNPHETNFTLQSLSMNTVYSVKIRAKDGKDRWSLWSKQHNVLTLKAVVIAPIRVAEQFAWVEWSREEQAPVPGSDLLITIEKPSMSHLRVFAQSDPELPIVDREFPGGVNKFQITFLTPNTAYMVEARVKNAAGEWGVWSEKRMIYTMRHLELFVTSRGEDYLKLQWIRNAPTGDPTAVLTDDSTVYTPPKTTVVKYRVNIVRSEDASDAITTDLEGVTEVLVSKLHPQTSYTATVRAFYGDEDWGLWSQPVQTSTLYLHTATCTQVGEDYINVSWSRQQSDPVATQGMTPVTKCFQVRIIDAKKLESLPSNEENILKDLFIVGDKTRVTGLMPNSRHRIVVRRWFVPVRTLTKTELEHLNEKEHVPEGPAVGPANTDGCTAGAWTEAIHVATIKPMVVIADDISEDFMCIRWERDTTLPSYPARSILKTTSTVQMFQIRIDQLKYDGTGFDEAYSTLHLDQKFAADTMTYRVMNLRPDTLYKVDVKALADGEWGLWSQALVILTLPQITVTVTSIGEDYASVIWDRKIRDVVLPEDQKVVAGNTSNLSKYNMTMYGSNSFQMEKKFKPNRSSYKVKRLDPNVVYTVTVQSADNNNNWSAPSDKVTFATLKPVKLSIGRVSENFVHVSWLRDPQSVEEYTGSTAPQLGDSSVSKFHLCVFPADHGPTTAFVDKQFTGDITSFPVLNLNPNTTYIFIVRACGGDGVWGLWSEEVTVTTLPLLHVQILSIGENYVAISWRRDDVPSTAPPNTLAVANVTSYHIYLTGVDNGIEYDSVLSIDGITYENGQPVYLIHKLKPDNKYVVTLQASYGEDELGLRTNPVNFVTLNQLGLKIEEIGETTATFWFGRAQQTNVAVGGRGEVSKYQLNIIKSKENIEALPYLPEKPQVTPSDQPSAGNTPDPAVTVNEPMTGGEAVFEDLPPIPPINVDDTVVIEKEMEKNQYSYIQTYCPVSCLMVNTRYLVRVRAMDDRQVWGEWTEREFETQPLPPSRPQIKKAGSGSVSVTWDPPDHISKYTYCVMMAVVPANQAKRSTKAQGIKEEITEDQWRTVDSTNDCFTKQRVGAPVTRLRFRVRCTKADNDVTLWSAWSPVASFAQDKPPEGIAQYKLVNVSTTAATIEWFRAIAPSPSTTQPSTTPTALIYRLLFAVKEAPFTTLGTTKATTYTLTDLEPNQLYRFQVVVENEHGATSINNKFIKFATRPIHRGDSLTTTQLFQAQNLASAVDTTLLTTTELPPIPTKPPTPPTASLRPEVTSVSLPTAPAGPVPPKSSQGARKSVSLPPPTNPLVPTPTPPQGQSTKRPQPKGNRRSSQDKKSESLAELSEED